MPDIAVVDYGTGNLRSVAKALLHVAPERTIMVSSDPATIRGAKRVVLPGQSAMPDCMRALDQSGLREVVMEVAPIRAEPALDARSARIRDMLKAGIAPKQIIKEEWGATSGNAYIKASQELNTIIASLL